MRAKKGVTQEELAYNSGISLSQIARIETGKINPTLCTLLEIAKYLKISKSLVSMYERNQRKPSFEILEGIADFFNVDMNTLHGVTVESPLELSSKDERDIQKRIQSIVDELNANAALSFYNGDQEMDEETANLLKISLESSIRLAKERAKEKYTPKKYKK